MIGVVVLAILELPSRILDAPGPALLFGMGAVGAWRYCWWFTHLIRSRIYALGVAPRVRRQAEALWNEGWRPRFVNFMMVTYRERPETTRLVLDSIVGEVRSAQVPARLFVGTGDEHDESIVEEYFAGTALDLDLDVVIVRQNQPGKRFAIGLLLRAMSRYGVEKDDLAVFMDGDSVLEEGTLRKCAPLFHVFPNLGAVTTDEAAKVFGPRWVQAWYDLRFAQRRLAMESHSLSRKVLTLTGRLSIFRGGHVVDDGFIRTVEADHLSHWLWGSFRFLSGDDKSTWYWLLEGGYDTLYVPDARCLTVENIQGNVYERVTQNLLRWSGNMLRTGARAIALGPRRVGPFIWWCLVDQRLSMWTTLSGPLLAALLALTIGPSILLAYAVWVVATRLCLSLVLFFYARGIYISFPFLLYLNQLVGSLVKIHLLFRLSKQRWLNRGDQRSAAAEARLLTYQWAMANFLTLFYLALFVSAIAVYAGQWRLPNW